MKTKSPIASGLKKVQDDISLWRASHKTFESEPAIRAELFSAEQMEQHGAELAEQHTISTKTLPDRLLSRLGDNEVVLTECSKMFSTVSAMPKATQHMTPAAEWLLDNFYLIEEQVHTARKHFPKGYSHELPQLAEGPSAGLPRVYDIALENISHGDGRLDSKVLSRFVAAYQTVTPLTLGELWAIPIMLRLALIENIRRVATRIMAGWHDQGLAITWSDRITETVEKDRKSVVLAVAEMVASNPPVTGAFVAELARRLQGQTAALALPLAWVEEILAEKGLSIDQLIHSDTQQQAADQVTISNSITSLRLLSAVDWHEFVEELSLVEHILREDPMGVYETMNFASRDHYRHVIETLAKTYELPEETVARAAIDLSKSEAASDLANAPDGALNVRSHVGYYLVDEGLDTLKKRLAEQEDGKKKGWFYDLLHFPKYAPLPLYLSIVLVLSLLFAWPFLSMLQHSGWYALLLALPAVPVILTTSQLAIKLVNWLATLFIPPHFLPRLDYSEGIPPEARCVVVIPTMIADADDLEELLEKLEVHYLANSDKHLQFGLLTDFKDAPEEVMDGDAELLRLADEGIRALNAKYSDPDVDNFFLCHRPRRWNESEGVWMGYERKRGKLCEFNVLLLGKGEDKFLLLAGNTVSPSTPRNAAPIRYVITLDRDTQLPRDAARLLVGTMMHPLNRPVYSEEAQRVVSGYAIMQPRVGVTLPSATRTNYARLFCADAGIDPYTRTVSDVYQDLFRQGSYIGKGIYDLKAFEEAVLNRFPENTVLSHDLIEGCYARSGLLSDVELYEDYPSTYSADVKRRHRWIRGDWQLLPWGMSRVPLADGRTEHNPLTALSRWKVIDNLRRSIVPGALLTTLLIGWFGASNPLAWTLAVLLVIFALPLFDALQMAARKPHDISWRRHLGETVSSLGLQCLRTVFTLIWLPFETWYSIDAVMITLWRMWVSHKHLLQWQQSHDAERTSARTLGGFYRMMWAGPVLALIILAALIVFRPHAFAIAVALPILLIWAVSPAITWWLSLPRKRRTFVPTAEQTRFLRVLARRTWAFFDRYVCAQDNWLPPDNMQEQPIAVVAHRTSPTNMGMALLANLAAHDFGYISASRLADRLDKSLTTMSSMERFRNHFYNWYDTRTLQPLNPHYISAVDSGNLAGHLMTLRPGVLALADAPPFEARMLEGLVDTADIFDDTLRSAGISCPEWPRFMTELEEIRANAYTRLADAARDLKALLKLAESLTICVPTQENEVGFWMQALLTQCRDIAGDAESFTLPASAAEADPELAMPTWRKLAEMDVSQLPEADRQSAADVRDLAAERLDTLTHIVVLIDDFSDMDFGFLYDEKRDLLSIGYNLNEQRLDASYYDLLASEARLTYFVGIARGQLPQESWFRLGRSLTLAGNRPVLLSWSGSMFEYLMPNLVMPSYEETLLDETCCGAVARQVEYGHQLKIPWGVSESGYNMLDACFNYQYRAFGVPGLGLKPGLGDDTVLAPYASVMSLMVDPESAYRNLQQLTHQGVAGRYGMYEAVDYTPFRLPRGRDFAVIRSFMAHHQGMSLLSLAYLLLDKPMQRRFLSDPHFQAVNLLLEERMPKTPPEYIHPSKTAGLNAEDIAQRGSENKLRVFTNPDRLHPAVQLLSNGQYHVMVSSAGGGYTRYRDIAITRWQEDATRDNWGPFFYLRDVATGEFWSTSYQPTLKRTDLYEAIFNDARAEFRIRENDFDAHTEIVVSPEDDAELRRIHITNRGEKRRTIEVTSYAEVVLAPPMADAQHPAFSNLFVETELVRDLQAIICTRRPGSSTQQRRFMFHLLAAHDIDIDTISYETERNRFIGHGRTLVAPAVMDAPMGTGAASDGKLSDSEGAVLDPIVSIRCRITLAPGQSASLDFVSGIGQTRDECIQLIDKFRDQHLADRVFDLAWTHSQVLLHQSNASVFDAQLYEQMAASIIYPNPVLRAEPAVLAANRRNQSGLWGQSISGDLPIVLVKIADIANVELVAQMVKAHSYWRTKGLTVDLVIWHEDHYSYRQNLQDMIMGLIPSGSDAHMIDRPGGIFVRSAQQMSREDRILVQSVARIIVNDGNGTLQEQVYRRRVELPLPRPLPKRTPLKELPYRRPESGFEDEGLILANPYGGFTPDGREYVITLKEDDALPAPWANVLSNPEFGTVISESGGAYTWRENAHEYRVTPWMNDPVRDSSGEAFYVRDEETGCFWSPTILPSRGTGTYRTRHGFGYSVFQHEEDGIRTDMTVYVAPDVPVKFTVLRLTNDSGRRRRLSVMGYVEWVLGDLRVKTGTHVVTEADAVGGTLFARNSYTMDFPGRVAFFDADTVDRSVTCDRNEFLGRNGTLRAPAALKRRHLSGRSGAGMDPCGAIHTRFELAEGESREIVFILGATTSMENAVELAQHYRNPQTAREVFENTKKHWSDILGHIQVQTPDPSVNVLANGWLLYQAIACRIQARSGYYQSGGAFGFRDQLQDSMSVVYALPDVARSQILACAAHQFPEGDVLHWWHPPLDRGVRTKCSDDFLWLPLAACRYIRITDDASILDEEIHYIEGRQLNPDEESFYDLPMQSTLIEPLYQHCIRALQNGMKRGEHGLPLMGSGDWNDGMDRVGIHGKGESVWLGFFQYSILLQFAPVARMRGDEATAVWCEEQANALREALEMHGWDGSWYRRAYFDDGTPLGSATNEECRIDCLVQSWSVLSEAAPEWRQRKAMESLDTHLVRRDIGLIQLLTPPFDKTPYDPGYIKGYLPGVRENGGQYTHAAVWATMAFALLGNAERAWELLDIINPIHHGDSADAVSIYKVEPYVVAADVYTVKGHEGRGGWSWYTGTAGWMYRLIVESLLGLQIEHDRLFLKPVLKPGWDQVSLDYRFGNTIYHIVVRHSDEAEGQTQLSLDDALQTDGSVPLADDGKEHRIELLIPRPSEG